MYSIIKILRGIHIFRVKKIVNFIFEIILGKRNFINQNRLKRVLRTYGNLENKNYSSYGHGSENAPSTKYRVLKMPIENIFSFVTFTVYILSPNKIQYFSLVHCL